MQLGNKLDDREWMVLEEGNIRRVDKFKCLGSLLDEAGNLEGEIKSRI